MATPHTHSQIELNFLLAGAVTYDFSGRQVRLAAGDFGFFWGAIPHQSIIVAPQTRFICIYLPVERFLTLQLSGRLAASVLAGAVVAASDPRGFDETQFNRIHADLSGSDHRLVELDRAEVEHLLRRVDVTGWRDLLGGSGQAAARPAAHVRAVAMARFMTARAADPIDVADVARAAGLHPNYAMTVFRQSFGMTIGHFLIRQRLHRAQALLTGTRQPVAAVAFECGFGSLSRFHASFRDYFGISPQRYRTVRLSG